jgi:CMP-N-acetylneuraminic acid synthetase|tara:strand:- start:2013 stop:2735 length:723 start_codon:yes stop_codon:yes gene_type:complete
MKILGIITARGGSKRVPRKNIKNFLDKPLLAWTIEAGLESGVLDRFILTTEDKEIAEAGKKYGIEVPFIRPMEFAQDKSSSYDPIRHTADWLKENKGYEADWIILLEPTAPGRQVFHVQEVAKLINERDDFDSIIGVSEMEPHFSYSREFKKDKKGIISRVYDGEILRNIIMRTQDVPTSYYSNSAIYAFKVKNLYDSNDSLWGDSTYGYIIDEKYVIDIDTPKDWEVGEIKMKKLLEEK